MLKILFPFLLMLAITDPARMPAWFIGKWTSTSANSTVTESWMMEGEILRGTSETTRNGKTVFTEKLLIKRNEEGKLVYIAEPMNQGETVFTEVESKDGFVAFENPQHDFPKRITYKLLDAETLEAEISGDGKSMKWTFKKN